jgi:putative transposase
MDENHLLASARYIERNPVRARIVKKPCGYLWSSAKEHSGDTHTSIIDTSGLFQYIEIGRDKWKDFIDTPDRPEDVAELRKHTMTGRPIGSEAFIRKLEIQFGERLHALPVGRPSNKSKK